MHKFIVDGMLGTIAKWLRILGYYTIFDSKLNDDDILKIAKRESLTIITADRELYKRSRKEKIPVIFFSIKNLKIEDILALLSLKLNVRLYIDLNNTRCPLCNTPLVWVPKEKVKDIVPKRIYNNYDKFLYCSKCNKAYWPGSHFNNMRKTLERAKRLKSKVYTY